MTNKEAIETIKTAIAEVEWEYPIGYAAAFDMAVKALEKQEVPDLVKVVRCRDCRFWLANNAEEGDASGMCLNLNGYQTITDMDWFCADGERNDA